MPDSFDDLPAELQQAPSALEIWRECAELAVFLIEKNKAYGDSALKPLRVMSKADPAEQIRVRMDDKLSRLLRGEAAGEDAVRDLFGYYVLLRICERKPAAPTSATCTCGHHLSHHMPRLRGGGDTDRSCSLCDCDIFKTP